MLLTPSSNPTTPSRGVTALIMDAESADETVSIVVTPGNNTRNHTITIEVSDPTVTGALQLETAASPDYEGEWSPLGSSAIDLANIAGALDVMFSNIVISALRARISTVVANGTVSVKYTGQ